jgi:asparagine synthase (glutamine-hydrolysing)
MCGLVGVSWREPGGGLAHAGEALTARLTRGLNAIAHRGPDDSGTFAAEGAALGFRRLSILDLTAAGHQPMAAHDNSWVVVFNGEIYNFVELAQELAATGSVFSGTSDSEVLVEALRVWGTDCFARFNGMWAVLAYEVSTQTLYATRDPWGIKPLYSCVGPHGTWFASEIKALVSLGCPVGDPNLSVLLPFLTGGEIDGHVATAYTAVDRLEPGILYSYRGGRCVQEALVATVDQGYVTPALPDDGAGDEAYVRAFRQALENAVKLRLRADVSIGASLSGGLDSTAVLCIAAQQLDAVRGAHCRHAFTTLIPEFDESRYIQAVINQTRADWHVTVATDEALRDNVDLFFRMHDEPIHSLGPLAGFLVMRLAHEAGVKVLLNGQGADELLAGYNSSIVPALRDRFANEGLLKAWQEACAETPLRRDAAKLLVHAEASRMALPFLATIDGLRKTLGAYGNLETAFVASRHRRSSIPAMPSRGLGLQDVLHDNLKRAPLPLYLRIEDQNSSAFSLEARLPFLDPGIVALAQHAPARLLRGGGLNKLLLRKVLPGLVPDIVHQRRDKMGFPVPHDRWIRGPLRETTERLLSPQRLRERDWYDVPAILAARDKVLAGGPLPPGFVRLLTTEGWFSSHFGY